MFKDFFFAELRYALRQPMVYIFLLLMALLTFGATASDNVVIGGAMGNVYKNAPHVITQFTAILTIFGLLIAAAYFNTAALKDHNHQFNEILFSTPLSKSGYFLRAILWGVGTIYHSHAWGVCRSVCRQCGRPCNGLG
jgi:ABC-2 type transport system permease protein